MRWAPDASAPSRWTRPSGHRDLRVPANTLTVNLVGNGNVSGGGGAINCGLGANICSANFAANASVTLVATPATGATFIGWTGACGGTSTTCTVSMNQSKSVTATFSRRHTDARVHAHRLGQRQRHGHRQRDQLRERRNHLYEREPSAQLDGDAHRDTVQRRDVRRLGRRQLHRNDATCTVTFNASKSVTATFTGGTSNVQLTVSVTGPGSVTGGAINCGNGSATCSAQVAQGTTVTLTAKPATGAKFAGWGGSCAGTATTCSVSMTSAKSVSATFTTGGTPGTLTINVGGKGTVSTTAGACTAVGPSKTCIQHFKAGASVTLAARPSAGQSFLGWSGACSGAKPTCTVKLTTAQTVTANFSSKATGGGGGHGPQRSPRSARRSSARPRPAGT